MIGITIWGTNLIRTVIFDQDNTLYLSIPMRDQFRNNLKKFLVREAKIEIIKYDEWLKNTLSSFGNNWYDILDHLNIDHHFYASQIIETLEVEKILKADPELVDCLQKLDLPIYIVTGSTPSFSKRVRNILGIEQLIKETYIVNYDNENCDLLSRKKIDYYNLIRKKEILNPQEICVVGDSYSFDLKDAENQGYHTVLINNKRDHNSKIHTICDILDTVSKINIKSD